jgi:hypothetical protein
MINKIKFNWATGIVLAYTGFVALTIIMVVSTYKQNIDLITPDYYEQELKFQQRQAELTRSSHLKENLKVTLSGAEIAIQFPENSTIKGEVQLFRPSDKKLDVRMPIKNNAGSAMYIGTAQLHKGMYKLQISWMMNDVAYFNEEIIVIP